MGMDTTHLDALEVGLSHERARLSASKSRHERELRTVWVAQLEKQISDEIKFLGLDAADLAAREISNMTDDELLAELMA
jgi:hypothetical protein